MKFIPVKEINKEAYKGKIYDLNVKNTHTYNINNIVVGNCSSGLHGVGVTCVNALADNFEVVVKRNGAIYKQTFSRGVPTSDVEQIGKTTETGTEIKYHPDKSIFKITLNPSEHVNNRLKELASLNPGIKIRYINDVDKTDTVYHFEDGITGYTMKMIEGKIKLYDNPFSFFGQYELPNGQLILCDIAFIHDDEAEPNTKIKSFANNVNTYEGGFHLQGFKNAYKDIINQYGIDKKLIKDPIEMKYLMDGMYCTISIKIPEAEFEGQTKTKLGNKEAQEAVEKIMHDFFDKEIKNKKLYDVFDSIINRASKVKEAEEAARKARSISRQTKKASKVALPGKLAECSNKNGYRELFLTEGDSAGGCFVPSTKIRLADSRILTIAELIEEQNRGIQNYVFSVNDDGNFSIVPILDVFKTKHVESVAKITLDNGEVVECTPEHLFMLRDGSYKKAIELTEEDSLMPFEFNIKDRSKKKSLHPLTKDYKVAWIYQNNYGKLRGRWIRTMDIACKEYLGECDKFTNKHHKDSNPLNNNPDNLQYLTASEHTAFHQKDFWSKGRKKVISNLSKSNWENQEYRNKLKFLNDASSNPVVIAHNEKMKNDLEYRKNVISRITNNSVKQKATAKRLEALKNNQEWKDKISMASRNQWNNNDNREYKSYVSKLQFNNPLELERIQLLETYKYISFLYNNFEEKMKLGQNGFSIGIYNRYVTKYNKKFNSHAVMWKVIQKKYFNTTDKLLEWYKKYIPDLVEKHTSKEILEQQKAEFKRNLFQKRMKRKLEKIHGYLKWMEDNCIEFNKYNYEKNIECYMSQNKQLKVPSYKSLMNLFKTEEEVVKWKKNIIVE